MVIVQGLHKGNADRNSYEIEFAVDLEGTNILEHGLQLALSLQRGDLVPAPDALAADEDSGYAPGPSEAPHVVLQESRRQRF